MRIATWNLNKPSKPRAARQIEILRAQNADIWVLTETNEREMLGEGYQQLATSEGDPTHREGEKWVSIWSRYSGKQFPLKNDPQRTACAIISPPDRTEVVVYGTVLPWRGSKWNDLPSAGGVAFSAALEAQCNEWSKLKGRYSAFDFCVAGDFNQDLNDRDYYWSKLGKHNLREALKRADLRCLTSGKNDPVSSVDASRANIDHICASTKLASTLRRPVESWPGNAEGMYYLSDHFGILVELA